MANTAAASHNLVMSGARSILENAPALFQIESQIEAIERNIDSSPAVVIDLARGLIESVCKTICRDLGVPIAKDANAESLVAILRRRLDLLVDPDSADAAAKTATRKAVGGLNALVLGIGEYRRTFGTASHGRDGYEGMLHPCHARLVVMMADALALFLYDMHRRLHGEEEWVRANFGEHPDFEQALDDAHDPSPIPIFGEEFRPSEVLFRVNKTAYVTRLNAYRRERVSTAAGAPSVSSLSAENRVPPQEVSPTEAQVLETTDADGELTNGERRGVPEPSNGIES